MKLPSSPDSPEREFFELLDHARSGDRDALGQLIDRHRPYLLKIASSEGDVDLQGKHGDSDVVQDTCIKALHDFRQFQGQSGEELRSWLRAILLHHLGDLRDQFTAAKRHARGDVSLQDLAENDSQNEHLAATRTTPSEIAVRREERALLEAALQELSELDRAIVELRQKDGRPFPEIARQLNLNVDAAQKRWIRAIHALKDIVNRRHGNAPG